MSETTKAIVTTSVGHPFMSGGKESLGNIGLDIDVGLPLFWNDANRKLGIVAGLGTMAHPQRSKSTSGSTEEYADYSWHIDDPYNHDDLPVITHDVADNAQATDQVKIYNSSPSPALSVVRGRVGMFFSPRFENFIGETDVGVSAAITLGLANMIDEPILYDIMLNTSIFAYLTDQISAGISFKMGGMGHFDGSPGYLYFEPSLALRFEL